MPRDHRLYLDDIIGAIDRIRTGSPSGRLP